MDKNVKRIRFEVVVSPGANQTSILDGDVIPSVYSLDGFRRDPGKSALAARKLQGLGVTIHKIGRYSISAECSALEFERLFGTRLTESKPPQPAPDDYLMVAPAEDAPWKLPSEEGLDTLLEAAYVQQDPIFFDERPIPPPWADEFRLRVPNDVAQIMRASEVHRRGFDGSGVTVAMPDTGFYRHPFFDAQGYNFLPVAAPDVSQPQLDPSGHGTGECANLFATAPGVNFIGIKMGNPTLAFRTAVELSPDIVTGSWGYSLDVPGSSMPAFLRPLYLEILDAVANGVTVCFAAGNGHFAFPGNMPEVISVGGVIVDENLRYSATTYTSGFDSTWFPGRRVPDVSGLCGERPGADYIVLPVPIDSALNREAGWGAFSGTSAAAPMVAGVCALLKQAKPDATPEQIKAFLSYTARDILVGQNAHGRSAAPGPDGATGFGLVDALRAVEAVL